MFLLRVSTDSCEWLGGSDIRGYAAHIAPPAGRISVTLQRLDREHNVMSTLQIDFLVVVAHGPPYIYAAIQIRSKVNPLT
jgi:hypothetical protein